MTEYQRSELRLINQLFFGLFLAANFGFYLVLSQDVFPWYSLLGAAVGLAIITYCWSETKYIVFIASLLVCSVVHTIAYHWGSIFNL